MKFRKKDRIADRRMVTELKAKLSGTRK